jgi:hypothetical protein
MKSTLLYGLLVSFCFCVKATGTEDLIKIPEGNNLKLTLHAEGNQIYKCDEEVGSFGWKWIAPEAKLIDSENQTEVGSHGSGPTWNHKDGSRVSAKMLQKIESPDADAVPWLLLEATEQQGVGVLTGTAFILRLNTKGGVAPINDCTSDTKGRKVSVPYSADYMFYGK